MSVHLYTISEYPWNKTVWARLDESAGVAGITVAELKAVCSNIGARMVDYKGWKVVDFGVLGASAPWRQLMNVKDARDTQRSLF